MKLKSFQKYLEKRLNKDEIALIEQQALLEKKALESLQATIAEAMNNYMKTNDIGFNELVRQLDISPTQVTKIQKGEANLTLSSLAHIFALLGQEPQLIFKKR